MGALLKLLRELLKRKPPTRTPPRRPNDAGNSADRRGSPQPRRGTPCAGCRRPNRRHDPCRTRGNDPTKTNNSMIDPDRKPEIDAEIDEIIAGNVEKVGEHWIAPSGRRYGRHNDALHPVDGPGIVDFTRPQHQLIKELNNKGLDGSARMMERFQELGMLTPEQVEQVTEIWRRCPR